MSSMECSVWTLPLPRLLPLLPPGFGPWTPSRLYTLGALHSWVL